VTASFPERATPPASARLDYLECSAKDSAVLTGPTVILALKIAVAAVTVILAASLVALLRGNYKLHGRLNLTFFILTLGAVLGFEVVIRVIQPEIFQYIKENDDLLRALNIHLLFSVPALLLMPAMLYSGMAHRRNVHLVLATLFGIAWVGTFVTGIFFLPVTH
jgi:uncharacterized membrane protein YozB (DUF420 family)